MGLRNVMDFWRKEKIHFLQPEIGPLFLAPNLDSVPENVVINTFFHKYSRNIV
jgi:hypothetical protein